MKVYTIKAKYLNMTGLVKQFVYVDGSPGLLVVDGSGPPEKLSINLGDYGLVPPEGHIYVPDYGAHEGVPQALITAGIATPVERVEYGDYDAAAWLMRLTIEKEN